MAECEINCLFMRLTDRIQQYGQNEETRGESTNFRNSQLILATVPKHLRKSSFLPMAIGELCAP